MHCLPHTLIDLGTIFGQIVGCQRITSYLECLACKESLGRFWVLAPYGLLVCLQHLWPSS
jgi:hypothetical protein